MTGGGVAAPPPKQELRPHPPKDQLPNIAYCVTSPPRWPEAIILGFQQYLVMLGTTILIPSTLVPQMGGGNIRARVTNDSFRLKLMAEYPYIKNKCLQGDAASIIQLTGNSILMAYHHITFQYSDGLPVLDEIQ